MYVDLSFHLRVWMKITISVFQWNLKWNYERWKISEVSTIGRRREDKKVVCQTSFSPSLIETHNKQRLYGCLYTRSLHMVIWYNSSHFSIFMVGGRQSFTCRVFLSLFFFLFRPKQIWSYLLAIQFPCLENDDWSHYGSSRRRSKRIVVVTCPRTISQGRRNVYGSSCSKAPSISSSFYFVWFSSYDFWSTRSAILLASQTACRTRWPASHLPRNSAEFRATWLQPSAQDQMLEFFKALLAIFPRQTSYMRYNTHAAALCSRMHLAHLGHTWK
jgi:hypothetical protein